MREQGGGAQREICWRGYQVAACRSGGPCTTNKRFLLWARGHVPEDSLGSWRNRVYFYLWIQNKFLLMFTIWINTDVFIDFHIRWSHTLRLKILQVGGDILPSWGVGSGGSFTPSFIFSPPWAFAVFLCLVKWIYWLYYLILTKWTLTVDLWL